MKKLEFNPPATEPEPDISLDRRPSKEKSGRKPKDGKPRIGKSFRLPEETLAKIDFFRLTQSPGEPMSESDALVAMLERYPSKPEGKP